MNKNPGTQVLRAAAASLLAFLATHSPLAAAQTWNGSGADNNWSTGANWVGATAPASSAATFVTFPAASARFAPVVDAPWTVSRIDIASATPYALSGQTITFGSPTGTLNTSLAAHTVSAPMVANLVIDVNNASSLTLSGPITAPSALVKTGAGTLTLSGASTIGDLVDSAGPLVVTGSVATFAVTVGVGGTLAGTGTVGPVHMVGPGSVIAPGPFPGPAPGVLNTGDLTIVGAAVMDIQGAALGSQYDNLDVTGTVNVLGATLTLVGAYIPAAGDVFTLVTNDGVDPVQGQFGGLPEGGVIAFNGVPLRISYLGGTGNDITLTALAAASTPAQVPTLSGWALALLALAMLGLGIHGARRRR